MEPMMIALTPRIAAAHQLVASSAWRARVRMALGSRIVAMPLSVAALGAPVRLRARQRVDRRQFHLKRHPIALEPREVLTLVNAGPAPAR
jgi:hypothetical protein